MRTSPPMAASRVGKHSPNASGSRRMESPMESVARIMDCTWGEEPPRQLRDAPTSYSSC